MAAQPPSHPTYGPKAFVVQVNDPDRGRQCIGRGDRRDPEDSAAEKPDSALRQPLVDEVGFGAVVRIVLLCVETVLPISDRRAHPSNPW